MARQDIRLSVHFPSHPKIKRLVKILGSDGAWYLVKLYLWTAANRTSGDFSGMSDEDIELAIDWTSEAGLVKVLLSLELLEGEPGQRRMHQWEVHQPWVAGAERRSKASQNAALVKHHGVGRGSKKQRF